MAENRTAAYQIIRARGPVARTAGGSYALTSGEYAEYALKHPDLFSSRRAFDVVGSPLPLVPIAFDPPEHARYRKLLQPFFSPRGTAAWRPRVRALIGELIGTFLDHGECDLVTDLAVPLPAEVFLTLFGLPLTDRDRLIGWKEGLLAGPWAASPGQPSAEVIRVGGELFEYLAGHITARRESGPPPQDGQPASVPGGTAAPGGTAEPGPGGSPDLLGRLIADTGRDRLSDSELIGMSFLFVLAGLDTVTSALSTAFAILAADPALRQQIAADPALIPGAVEELLRIDGPVVFVPRVATTDVELDGQVIPAGAQVQVTLAAANRDPAGHEDPDRIEFRRQEPHLAFGGGPHRCLGSHLARMEMREVLREWHRRIPEYQLAPGSTARISWPSGLVGLDHLPLVFPPGGRAGEGG
jgi:cytochrome P450